jgi:hypothetical protein
VIAAIAARKRRRRASGVAENTPSETSLAGLDAEITTAVPSRQDDAPPPDPFEIGRLGTWSIIKFSDATKKRALARCLACSETREISLVGAVPSCCGSAARPDAPTFATNLAAAERLGARHRHKGSGL